MKKLIIVSLAALLFVQCTKDSDPPIPRQRMPKNKMFTVKQVTPKTLDFGISGKDPIWPGKKPSL